jgi:hypothetical protein
MAAVMLVAAVPAVAATKAAPAAAPLTAEAKSALEAMSAYLRTLKNFELTADGTGSAVDKAGQAIEYGAQLHYVVSLPDKLFAEISIGARNRQMFYDGSKLTISAPEQKFYADVPVSGTLVTLLTKASTNYGIDLPLHQLFQWGNAANPAPLPASGFKVGTAKCGTAICDQYAFRQPAVDWQLWIQQGAKPLPVRLVFTDRISSARPSVAVNLTWNTDGPIAADRFTFTPAADAIRIAIKSEMFAKGGKK